jgi:ABC-type multidrug transport system ATPase subunit
MSPTIIQVQNLTKHFKETRAVNGLSFSVAKGEIYGFLGQNGAGKSTTIRMLLTLIEPTSGVIKIFDKELKANRMGILKKVGAIIEKPDLYKYLTAKENLKLMARISGVAVTNQQLVNQLEIVGLAERRDSKVKTFSQGMKQRLGLACALIHNPDLLILDEPTNGLDPQGIADIRNLILHLSRNEGKTIVVSSHLLSEMELISDSMLIIDKGKKVAEGKINELLNPADTLLEISTTNDVYCLEVLADSQWGKHLRRANDKILLRVHKDEVPQLNRFLVQQNIDVLALQPKHSLEDYFLSLTTSNQHVAAYTN